MPFDVTDLRLLAVTFQSGDTISIHKSLFELERRFKPDFKRLGRYICLRWPVTKNKEDDIIDTSFNDGLLSFYLKIKRDGAYNTISVEDLLRLFFLNKLRGQLKSVYRKSKHEYSGDPDNVFTMVDNDITLSHQPDLTEEIFERQILVFNKAYSTLQPDCRNLIEWRKLQRLKSEDIAEKTNLSPVSVNNEVYRCMKYLKTAVDNINTIYKRHSV